MTVNEWLLPQMIGIEEAGVSLGQSCCILFCRLLVVVPSAEVRPLIP